MLSDFASTINKDYLYFVLSSAYIKEQFANEARGAIVKNLNIDIVKDVLIPLPELSEQNKIVKVLEKKYRDINELSNFLKENSIYISNLPNSILKQAFEGKL